MKKRVPGGTTSWLKQPTSKHYRFLSFYSILLIFGISTNWAMLIKMAMSMKFVKIHQLPPLKQARSASTAAGMGSDLAH